MSDVDSTGYSILLETDDMIAVNKHEDIAVIRERDPDVPYVQGHLEEAFGQKLYVVHRLDKEVSGVLLFARNADCHRYLNGLFSTRKISKSYLAAAHGIMEDTSGTIDEPIRPFGSGRVGVDPIKGKESATRYTVVERFPHHTALRVEPVTGRRHQIRVHLYHIGHPLVGDRRYGEREIQTKYPRLLLHAHSLAFHMPDGDPVEIVADPPASFYNGMDALRAT